MDVVWLIVDSLSYSETSFADPDLGTTPKLFDLAGEHATIFNRAYAPGPSSPSSHGAFFTNELPSKTGMHEATPVFSSDLETIAGALDRPSYLISTNPFIFNGLERDFDEVDDLRVAQYIRFPEATDPHKFILRTDFDRGLRRWLSFVFSDGKPLRSFINGVSYKLWMLGQHGAIPRSVGTDDLRYQYVNTMNRRIRSFLADQTGDSLVVANYMDVHPPLNATQDAIDRFAGDESRDDLPIEVAGQEVLEQVKAGDQRAEDLMMKLYHAAIWDLDRELAPFIEDLLDRDSIVIVTADHGNWFRRREEFETELIHVPLLIFVPGHSTETVDHTVNIRDLPSTTMDALGKEDPFSGESLLSVSADRVSITESIHEPHDDSPVAAHGGGGDIIHDIALIEGDTRLEYVAGEFHPISGSEETLSELRRTGESLLREDIRRSEAPIEYDDEIEERLADLGYK